MIHVIEIREIVGGTKPGTVKFKSTANLTYNCNKPEFNSHWAVGEKYKIDFNVSSFNGSRGPVEMKWINNARFWKDGDGPVDPPEKPVYQGGGGSYQKSSGGGSMKKDYDPELSKKQTSANCAMQYCGNAGMTLEDLKTFFPQVAAIVFDYLNSDAPKSGNAGVADSGGEASSMGDVADQDADIEF